MTDDSAFKKQVRTRMAETGEKYTVARRMVIAGRDPGRLPVALRVFLNPHVDLELTSEAARAYGAADELGRREMASRLLTEHIELAGSGEAGVTAGSEIMTVQALLVEEIVEVVRRRIGQAAGVSAVAIGGDLDQVQIDIEAARPGVVSGHGGAEVGRLRAELEELTGKPVLLSIGEPRPQAGLEETWSLVMDRPTSSSWPTVVDCRTRGCPVNGRWRLIGSSEHHPVRVMFRGLSMGIVAPERRCMRVMSGAAMPSLATVTTQGSRQARKAGLHGGHGDDQGALARCGGRGVGV